jgi:hypothetical protein
MRIAAIVAVVFAAASLLAGDAREAGGQNPAAVAELKTRSSASSGVARFEGAWNTTKFKKLDGTLSCQLKPLAKDRWQGRFWGVWQQVPFDYTVEFAEANDEKANPATAQTGSSQPQGQRVRGTATIDGAHYDWVGNLTPARFDVQFTGSRYEGRMELKRVADQRPQP